MADKFVDARLVDAHAQARSKSAYETLALLEARLADGTTGSIQENYSSFLDALQLMASDPATVAVETKLPDLRLNSQPQSKKQRPSSRTCKITSKARLRAPYRL